MAFPTTTNGWISYVRNWIGADEYSDAQISAFLDLGTAKLNADLTSYYMEALFHHTQPSETLSQPIDLVTTITDFNKIRLVSVQGVGPLDVAALNEYVAKSQDLTDTTITPEIYNIDAGNLYIWPWPAEGAIIDIYYYVTVPALSTSLNSTIFSERHPELLLYAAALEAASYMVEDERIPVWESKYTVGVLTANNAISKIKMGSTPLLRKIVNLS